MRLCAFIIAIILGLGWRSELLFTNRNVVSGAFIPSPKSKYGLDTVTEDAFMTTPQVIAVADGLSGTDFNTGFLANFLAKYGTEYILTMVTSKEFQPLLEDDLKIKLNLAMNSIVQTYTEEVTDAIKVWAVKNNLSTEKTGKSVLSASTFVSGFLKEEDDFTFLNVFQKGDSMAMVFRMVKSESNPGRYLYLPIFATPEMQLEHNAPYQYSTKERGKNGHVYVNKLVVERGDLVLMGSDGLFDNLNSQMLTFIINYLVAAAQTDIPISKIITELVKRQKWFKTNALDVDPSNFRGPVFSPEPEPVSSKPTPTPNRNENGEGTKLGRLLSKNKPQEDEGPSGLAKFFGTMFGCGIRDDKKNKPKKDHDGMPSIGEASRAKQAEEFHRKQMEEITYRQVHAQNSIANPKMEIDVADLPYVRVSKVSKRNFGNMTPAQIEYFTRLNSETEKAHQEAREKELKMDRVRGKDVMGTWDIFGAEWDFFKDDQAGTAINGQYAIGDDLTKEFVIDSAVEPVLDFPLGGPKSETASTPSSERNSAKQSQHDIAEETEGDQQIKALLANDDDEGEPSSPLGKKVSNLVFSERVDGAGQIFIKAPQSELFATHGDSKKNARVIPRSFSEAFDKHFDFSTEELAQFAKKFDPQVVSYIVAKVAKEFSVCADCLTPFRVNGFKYGKSKVTLGGKKDDITAVLNMIMNLKSPTDKAMLVFRQDILNRIERVHRALKDHVAYYMDHFGA